MSAGELSSTPAPVVSGLAPDSRWYKDAVIYELAVRSFADSNADGIGDFPGLTARLDYLSDLGVNALWLLPFYPSPLRDDGYDISDYTDVHPNYGTLHDFRVFLREAHASGIRVIIELVLNHTSDQHPWFQRARRAPAGSAERDYYVWSDTPEKFSGARIIFKDFESSNWSWDALAKAYYWHRFYSHQPDLNYDSPAVVRSIFKVLDFWLDMGVDAFRLDAVPYLYKREGTNCENLPETHAFLKLLRRHVDERYTGRMLLAEANQWPEDAASYFGQGDEVHTAFHFPLMPRLFMGTRVESRYPIVDILQQTPTIPESCQWLLFLRNHDELTLEMVSDEERDYMYRVYAADPRMRLNLGIRRRLAPLLQNDRRLIELMNGLLFSLPGTPVLYYGDEIGMGENIYLGDRNGVRTPMQWSGDRNAGFSRANPQSLVLPVIIDPEYHYEAINVEAQQANPHSLLWHMKRLISLRKQSPVLGRGKLSFLFPENPRVLAFVREDEETRVLVIANLSHLVQVADLHLAAYAGQVPVELFGRNEFPAIGETPYRFTLGPYDFFWFRLTAPPSVPTPEGAPFALAHPEIAAEGRWESFEHAAVVERIEAALPEFLAGRRWFQGKAYTPSAAHFLGALPLGRGGRDLRLAFAEIEFTDTEPQTYLLPLRFEDRPNPGSGAKSGSAVLAVFRPLTGGAARALVDAGQDPSFVRPLVDRIARNRRTPVDGIELVAVHAEEFPPDAPEALAELPVTPIRSEQSNSSVNIGDRFILKLFRSLGDGTNPEVELGLFLQRHGLAELIAPVEGYVEVLREGHAPQTLAVLHRFIPNEGPAWEMTLRELEGYFERVRAFLAGGGSLPTPATSPLEAMEEELPPLATELVGPYLDRARRLGSRTAAMHAGFASDASDPAFAPESFDQLYLRSIFQTMQSKRAQAFDLLREHRSRIDPSLQALAELLLTHERDVERQFRTILGRRISAQRTRFHGDYHLGQLLWTGKDFVIIDFEGEPVRSLSERRIKRSPLRDVAGLLRSFDYAVNAALRSMPASSVAPGTDAEPLRQAGRLWTIWVSTAFLETYRKETASLRSIPSDPTEFRLLVNAYFVEKACYELGYELNNRPDWLEVPLRGLLTLLGLAG